MHGFHSHLRQNLTPRQATLDLARQDGDITISASGVETVCEALKNNSTLTGLDMEQRPVEWEASSLRLLHGSDEKKDRHGANASGAAAADQRCRRRCSSSQHHGQRYGQGMGAGVGVGVTA